MAQVTFSVGDRAHVVTCAAGAQGTEREMLLIALMLADDLDDALNAPPPAAIADERTLAALAERLETLASALEADGGSA